MTNENETYHWIVKTSRLVLLVVLTLLVIGLATAIIQTVVAIISDDSAKSSDHVLNIVMILISIGVAVVIFGVIQVLVATLAAAENTANDMNRVATALRNQGLDIQSLASLARLSDHAKSLIYHEQECEALQEHIHAMLLRQDYKSAEAMITRMETTMGMVDEAARLRKEIEATKQATVDEKIDAAIKRIQSIIDKREWQQARRETKRLLALFPDKPVVTALPNRIRDAWNAYKGQLLKEYGEACSINDVERSIRLLEELDKYLTPHEGAALKESARDVFKKKLHNLGVQFAIAVTEQEWNKAVATGEEIIRAYPNSRMSREVREKLPLLKDYASGVQQPPVLMDPNLAVPPGQMQAGQIPPEQQQPPSQ